MLLQSLWKLLVEILCNYAFTHVDQLCISALNTSQWYTLVKGFVCCSNAETNPIGVVDILFKTHSRLCILS